MENHYFPSSKYEALAMLYVQNQDISKMSPEELFKLYQQTVQSIRAYAAQNRNADWMKT